MTFSPTSRQIVLQEVFDEGSVPTEEEIRDYALKIGINVENESHLLYLARDGLMEALPPGWKPCYDEDKEEIYYFNFNTRKAQWEHPLDEVYRNLVKRARNESVVAGGDQVDDDSRTSIKEDLKSFEEASLILPSSEMYPKSKVLEPLSPLGLGSLRRSPTALVGPMKKSTSKELLKGGALKLPMEIDEDLVLSKGPGENEVNRSKKSFEESEVKKRPNSSDIRNRRNIGPMEFRHLSKQEIITPKYFGKNLFASENKKTGGDASKTSDIHSGEFRTADNVTVVKDEGYATEFSASSLVGEKEFEARGDGCKRELTVSGGGSVFLKSNKNKFSPCSDVASLTFSKEESSEGLGSSIGGKKSTSDADFHSKGILREHKFARSFEKELGGLSDGLKGISRKNCEEDRKSVRFNLEKDLKVNFEMPERSHLPEYKDVVSSESKTSKVKHNPVTSSVRSEVGESRKQIELDFEELEMNLGDSVRVEEEFGSKIHVDERGEDRRIPANPEPPKTVKPKKFKSSQSLVQEFREIFEAKSKTKINIPISSPLKVEEAVRKPSKEEEEEEEESEEEEEGESEEKSPPGNPRKEAEKASPVSDVNVDDGLADASKPSLTNLIDLTDDCDETKDSVESVNESQRESTKTDRSLLPLLKDEIMDSDLAGLVDYALKNKLFDGGVGAAATHSESSDGFLGLAGAGKSEDGKEKTFLLDEILRMGESDRDRSEGKILGGVAASPNLRSEVANCEKASEDGSGRYEEKKKSETLKNLEADFNEWLSDTEKLFEERKSNALVKMKENFEDWRASRESEFAAMYNEKREEERENKCKELRNEFVKKEQEEMDKLRDQLEREKKEKLSHLKVEMENETEREIQRMRELLEERLNEEKSNIMQKHKEELDNVERTLQQVLSDKQIQKKVKEMEMTREGEKALEELRERLKADCEEQKTNLTKEHETVLDDLRQQHAASLQSLRADFEKEEEALKKFHADRLDEMILKLGAIETKKLEIVENQKPDANERRMYAKVLFEKWFLEDEYETLKEKYLRLKSEAKQSLERKHKKSTSTTASETERSSSKKSNSIFRKSDHECLNAKRSQENEKKVKLKKPFANLDNLNQNVSAEEEEDDENVASVLSPSEHNRKSKKSPEASNKNRKSEERERRVIVCEAANESPSESRNSAEPLKKNHSNDTKKRRQLFSRLKALSTSRINSQNRTQNKEMRLSPVENLRRQLKKLEELEDQFPVTTHTDTYMRYPFTDIPQVGSSEIEFFKHRIHLERESVRRAKESLKTQKKSFENRQRELKQKLLEGGPEAKAVMEQIYQEERELTDMEVSVHRTRALLGEKIIRLRHLEQSLKRISEPRKKDSFMNKDVFGRLGFRNQSKDEDRTLSDLSSHSGSSGFSSTDVNLTDTQNGIGGNRAWNKTNAEESRRQFQNNMQESSEIIQSLENLNSEIREIWEVLKKQHQSGQGGALLLPPPPLIYGDGGWPAFTLTPPMAFRNTIITSNSNVERSVAQQLKNQVTGSPNSGHVTTVVHSSLVDRTKSLRDWLKAARNSSTPSEVVSPNQVTL